MQQADATSPPVVSVAPPSAEPPAQVPGPGEIGIGRTRLGLGFLFFAILLLWIPIIQYLGLLLGAIGAILIILGREPFGDRHGILVMFSVFLFILAYAIEFALVGGFLGVVQSVAGGFAGPNGASQVLAAWDGWVVGIVVVVSLIGLSSLLIAFDLEDLAGRLVLLAGLLSQALIAVGLYVFVFGPVMANAVSQAFATSPPGLAPLEAAVTEIQGLSMLRILNAIPAVLFAGAYAWAWVRIERGVIPRMPKPVHGPAVASPRAPPGSSS